LESEIAQLKDDVKTLRGTEKDEMKTFIKGEESKQASAELAVRQGGKALVEINGRLATA
jgi:hypothetical protein